MESLANYSVWTCDDLRKEIFSFIRKEPDRKCVKCSSVCVWDRKVKDYINVLEGNTYCIDCYKENNSNCIVS